MAKEMEQPIEENRFGNLLVLGNGFDLDLGYHTRYDQFANNGFDPDHGEFPFARGGVYHSLGKDVCDAICNNWYDLENVLALFGEHHAKIAEIKDNKADYALLVERLTRYLTNIDYSHPDKKSVAARLLRALFECLAPFVTYTFNYTDFTDIGDALDLDVNSATHVHGSLKEKDIILGVGDYAKLDSASDFLYKTSNDNYHSTELVMDLNAFDSIYIFGLSLSSVDYPYFEDFFKRIASGVENRERRKYIRIFTYDDKSKMEILRNLRRMNQRMIALFNYADFDIVRTKDNIDESKVAKIIEKISTEWQFDV